MHVSSMFLFAWFFPFIYVVLLSFLHNAWQVDQAASVSKELRLVTPGFSPTDPHLKVLNLGKFRAMASLVSILRDCQKSPYSFATSTDTQTYLQKRAIYRSEEVSVMCVCVCVCVYSLVMSLLHFQLLTPLTGTVGSLFRDRGESQKL